MDTLLTRLVLSTHQSHIQFPHEISLSQCPQNPHATRMAHILLLDSILSFIERRYTSKQMYPPHQQTFKVQLSPTANATQTASYITHTCCKTTGIRRRSSTSGSMTGTSTSETIIRYIFMDTRVVSTISLLFSPFLFTPINVLYI